MNYIECENERNCGRYLQVLNIEIEYFEKAWLPYCRQEITQIKLESLRKKYNKEIKLLISSFAKNTNKGRKKCP